VIADICYMVLNVFITLLFLFLILPTQTTFFTALR